MPELPEVPDLHELTRGLTHAAREAAVVAVGLGVMGIQRAQVRRVAIQRLLADNPAVGAVLGDVRTEVSRHAGQVDEVVGTVLEQLRTTFEPLEAQLPSPAREAARLVHEQADGVRARLRELLTVPSAGPASAQDDGEDSSDSQ
jgi:hypothetical protein